MYCSYTFLSPPSFPIPPCLPFHLSSQLANPLSFPSLSIFSLPSLLSLCSFPSFSFYSHPFHLLYPPVPVAVTMQGDALLQWYKHNYPWCTHRFHGLYTTQWGNNHWLRLGSVINKLSHFFRTMMHRCVKMLKFIYTVSQKKHVTLFIWA